MEKIIALFFDTETTGIPDWKTPSDGPDQPHIVQLAAELVDTETREVIGSMDVIVKPDGWTIPEEMTAIHGISQEHAMEVGIPERDAIAMLLELRSKANLRVAHNRTFDDRIVRIGLKRFFDQPNSDETALQPSDSWKEGEGYCTCNSSRKLCALPKNKLPSLAEAHRILVGAELEGAHNAMNDTRGCKSVYFAIRDSEDKP
jgi:DNA polymerase-3 subunit epsilon